jgi:hypothetical protein
MNKPCVQETRFMRLIPWTLWSGSEQLQMYEFCAEHLACRLLQRVEPPCIISLVLQYCIYKSRAKKIIKNCTDLCPKRKTMYFL